MSLKMKVWTLVDIALRVPPVFVMDAALNYSLSPVGFLSKDTNSEYVPSNETENGGLISGYVLFLPTMDKLMSSIFRILIYLQVFFIALFVFLLSTKQLVSIYIRLTSVALVLLAYKLNVDYIDLMISNRMQIVSTFSFCYLIQVTCSYFLQMVLAILLCFTNTISGVHRSVMGILFLAPTVISTFFPASIFLRSMPLISAIGSFLLLAYSMWANGLRVCESVYKGVTWCHNVVENYGLYTMLETHWLNLHIPHVFRVFWIIRLTEHIISFLCLTDPRLWSLYEVFKILVVKGSENIVALLGMTSVIAYISQTFGYAIQSFLVIDDPDDKNVGNISAVLFFILALQTGVTGLDPEKRFVCICRNFCLLYTALMHFVYNILNPVLLSLSASRNPCIGKHVRALTVSLFLIITPIYLLVHQWSNQTTITWLLALTSFMLELVIKSITSLLIYVLFMVDACRNGLWEKLDDYIYYLKAVSSAVEFLFGIFLLGNGLWIFVFESSGAIRACMMCLHAYFNVWTQAKTGWESFLLRRSALHKINILPEATSAQLRERNDVCAICFQDLNSARITRCNHYFHGICLRKWLNVQDMCPLCLASLCDAKIQKKNDISQWNIPHENLEVRLHD